MCQYVSARVFCRFSRAQKHTYVCVYDVCVYIMCVCVCVHAGDTCKRKAHSSRCVCVYIHIYIYIYIYIYKCNFCGHALYTSIHEFMHI
jgi:hypothetical protein